MKAKRNKPSYGSWFVRKTVSGGKGWSISRISSTGYTSHYVNEKHTTTAFVHMRKFDTEAEARLVCDMLNARDGKPIDRGD